MKIGIYTPYLDTVGGGEKYMLTIAEILSRDHQVEVFLDEHLQALNIEEITNKTTNLLNIDLSKTKFIKAPLGKGSNILERLNFLRKYDLLFYLTDGSIFYSSAKRNILHIQSPLEVSRSIIKRIKSSSWDLIIYNSEFTKKTCEKYWNIKGEVIYPPVDTNSFKRAKKKKQILTVGRFFEYSKIKKHELLIESFKNLVDNKKISDWSLFLAGGADEGNKEYVERLKKLSENYPIQILPNINFKDLLMLYSESAIYWHGAGFGETDPAKMEHFGITTVEAMASGCVPVVINLGGQTEIVDDNINGFLWNNKEELETKTLKLIKDKKLLEKFSDEAIHSSKKFSKEKFSEKIHSLI